ncbi:hypothetical protein M5D96_002336, partial [Drosophila gunungcola]
CTYLCSYVHICTDHNVHTHTKESEHPGTHTLTICVYRFQSNTRASTDKFYLQTFHLICKRVAAPPPPPLHTTHTHSPTHTLPLQARLLSSSVDIRAGDIHIHIHWRMSTATATLTVDWVSRTWHGAPPGPRGKRRKMEEKRGGKWRRLGQMLSASHDEYDERQSCTRQIEIVCSGKILAQEIIPSCCWCRWCRWAQDPGS